MKEIRIEYKVGCIFKRAVRALIPETYDEMTSEQFHALMSLSRKECSEEHFVHEFYGVKARLWSKLDKFYLLKLTDMLRELREGHKVNFFYDEFIKVGGKMYLSPQRMLTDMTLQQFMSIDHFYSWYVYSGKVDYLVKFMAVTYVRENDFLKLDFERAYCIFKNFLKGNEAMYEDAIINWMLIKNWLSSSYTYLFPASEGQDSSSKNSKPTSWTSFFDSLVGEDIANIDSYKKLKVMDVFRMCNNRIKEQKKRKK